VFRDLQDSGSDGHVCMQEPSPLGESLHEAKLGVRHESPRELGFRGLHDAVQSQARLNA